VWETRNHPPSELVDGRVDRVKLAFEGAVELSAPDQRQDIFPRHKRPRDTAKRDQISDWATIDGDSHGHPTFDLAQDAAYAVAQFSFKTWNGSSATADADNELTTDPSNSNPYHWNERQELQHVASPDYNFYYDSAGRRETFDAFGVDTSYLYDSMFAAQSTTSGTPDSTQNYLTTPGGDVLAYSVTSGSTTTTTVPLSDLLGSTLGMVNSAGSLFTTFTYEPFGKPTTGGQSTTYPYLFAGMEYDAQTGLYHTLARYYNPTLQRFITEDPLNFGGGNVNLFAYAGNDPVNSSDPLGLDGYGAYGNTAPITNSAAQLGGEFGTVAVSVGDDEAVIFFPARLQSLVPKLRVLAAAALDVAGCHACRSFRAPQFEASAAWCWRRRTTTTEKGTRRKKNRRAMLQATRMKRWESA
jgi:RHS repeat-associated protein